MPQYELLFGVHIGSDGKGGDKHYKAGDIITADEDLLKLNGQLGMTPKFRLVGHEVPPETQIRAGETLQQFAQRMAQLAGSTGHAVDSMTVEELKRHAEDEEIDIGQLTDRDSILKVVKAHHGEN